MIQLLAKRASAGSGKTTALVFRYILLLLKGAKPSEIVALTFTVKAANNMKERIVSTLSNISKYPFLDELAAELELGNDEVVRRASELSSGTLLSQMKISTLDSFFSSILSKFCFYAGVPYGFETLERSDLVWLKRKFLASLSLEQKSALAFYLSGHKKKLSYFFELFELFDEKNLEPKNLFPTLKNANQNLLLEAKRLTEAIVSELSTDRERNLFTFTDLEELVGKKIFEQHCLNDHGWLKKKQFSSAVDSAFDELKKVIGAYFASREKEYADIVSILYDGYKDAKFRWMNRDGKLTFADISTSVHKLLCGGYSVDTDFLYFRLDSKINHILIDEFQDTSLLQYEIIKPLIDEIASGIGQNGFASFFFVGDIKQSIYRFRGGFSQLFDAVADSLDSNGLVVEKLNTNYRSDKNIVEFANKVFIGLLPSYEMQEYKDTAKEGYVEVLSAVNQKQEGDDETHPLVLSVIEKIDLLIESGVAKDDIAVLTPTNSDSIAVLDAIRERTSYKATQEISAKVVEQREPKAIINYLKYCFYGDDIFKETFLAISSHELFSEVDKISKYIKPSEAVTEIMSKFELFSPESFKLAALSTEYNDMYDFVQNIENNGAKMPEGKGDGIRVLTIHKSKGLEFGYVICMDRIAQKGQGDDDILIEYDDLVVKRVFFRFSKRELFDEEYAHALALDNEQSRRDRINMLYVAFTRAEHGMFIIKKAPNIKNDGSDGSYTGIFGLLDLKDEKIGKLEVVAGTEKQIADTFDVLFESQEHGRQKLKADDESQERDILAIYFGLALHGALELIDFGNIDGSIEQAVKIASRKYPIYAVDSAKILSMAKKAMQSKEFVMMLNGKKIYKECSFIYNGEIKRIDLLLMNEGSALIVDYKSSMFAKKEHLAQVQYYGEAVEAITGFAVETRVLALG